MAGNELDPSKTDDRGTVLFVVGARPNYMKVAPILRALESTSIQAPLVHTGQHYDPELNAAFFADLEIKPPVVNLMVGGGSHAVQTAEVMTRFEPVLDRIRPRAVLVVGDVNSTLACALVAVKKQVPVVHVEAGLRSFDRSMPEEINRVLTDQISDLLFVTERDGLANLAREGIPEERVRFVGNVMIDSLRHNLSKACPPTQAVGDAAPVFLDQMRGGFGVLTLHRPSTVDDPAVLATVLDAIRQISYRLPIVFPMHPRAVAALASARLEPLIDVPGIHRCKPLGYLKMLGLLSSARVVLTDSGGIQEETTALGVPCLTLRENTERPVTIREGTNTLVGYQKDRILKEFEEVLATGGKTGKIPHLWDGHAAERIVGALLERL